jgi:hypothetical protein
MRSGVCIILLTKHNTTQVFQSGAGVCDGWAGGYDEGLEICIVVNKITI